MCVYIYIECINFTDFVISLAGKPEGSLKNSYHRWASEVQGMWQTVHHFR